MNGSFNPSQPRSHEHYLNPNSPQATVADRKNRVDYAWFFIEHAVADKRDIVMRAEAPTADSVTNAEPATAEELNDLANATAAAGMTAIDATIERELATNMLTDEDPIDPITNQLNLDALHADMTASRSNDEDLAHA